MISFICKQRIFQEQVSDQIDPGVAGRTTFRQADGKTGIFLDQLVITLICNVKYFHTDETINFEVRFRGNMKSNI